MSDQTAVTATAVNEIAALAERGAEVQRFTVGDAEFADRALVRINSDPQRPETLEFYTLAGFVKYLEAEDEDTRPLIHVVNAGRVDAVSELYGADLHLRRNPARAVCKNAAMHGFSFNNAVPIELLTIALQTCFEPGRGQIDDLRQFCASVRSTSEIGVDDDGVSQSIAAKSGIAATLPTRVNNPWRLAPWRTFSEIPQPESPYILRFIKGEEPRAGLFETGDARWQVEAVEAIAKQLRVLLGQDWKILG